jgi:lipoate---protein ligase
MTEKPYADAMVRLPGPYRKNDDIFSSGARLSLPFVHVYVQPDSEVVYGPACKPEQEIRIDACRADGVVVTPRRGGGGTVILSPGMVITLVVGHRVKGESPHDIFGRIHDAMIRILSAPALQPIEKAGISDLAVNGKKILGSSLYLQQSPSLYYYQSSLMVDSDPSLIDTYLLYPPKEPEYRQGRNHKTFCTTLAREGWTISAADIARTFSQQLALLLS